MKVIIVNGYPRTGKDTFCDIAHEEFSCVTYSTVDTVKEIATTMGWDGTKTPENRAMLSALKDFTTEWFDMTFNEMTDLIQGEIDYTEVPEDGLDFIFLHIREPKEIKRMVDWCESKGVVCYKVCIQRDSVMSTDQSNHADKEVHFIQYDAYINNNGTIEEFKENTINYLQPIHSGSIKERKGFSEEWVGFYEELKNE